jgi:glycosyltransferase involved in cell wall biosynthesis
MALAITVIIPTHNPHPKRLRRTLDGLRAQTLPAVKWDVILVDNASDRFPAADFFADCRPANFTILSEPILGLTAARRRGLAAAPGNLAVLVDDDNVLAPDYLTTVIARFEADPRLGAAGGKSMPEFAVEPPAWAREFFPLLALRDLGEAPMVATTLRPAGSERNEYPVFAPIGAGMALRRSAWEEWMKLSAKSTLTDRRGASLSSGGDNEIVLQIMRAGWSVAYFPDLVLTHLIPPERLSPDYLARLNQGIQKSWMRVLSAHEANPWPALSPAGARLRQVRAWFSHRAWSGAAARIRWQGACGHFTGRVTR